MTLLEGDETICGYDNKLNHLRVSATYFGRDFLEKLNEAFPGDVRTYRPVPSPNDESFTQPSIWFKRPVTFEVRGEEELFPETYKCTLVDFTKPYSARTAPTGKVEVVPKRTGIAKLLLGAA